MMLKKRMGKQGGFTDIFLFMIVSLIVVFFSGIMIYVGIITTDALHDNLDDMDLASNMTEVIDNSMGEVNNTFQALYWISILLIVGMAIAIFMGSYMVTEKPVFFFFYIFIVIIAIVVAVVISMAYTDFRTQIESDAQLTEVFDGFVGANLILSYFPLWVAIIGIVGGIIVASRIGKGQESLGGYYG